MSHLTLESLARLVDEAATPEEEDHLLACGRCRDELTALREQQDAVAALPRLLPAPDAWPEIRSKLHAEGLVRAGGGGSQEGSGRSGRLHRLGRPGPAWRAAAAVLLFLAGGVSGYALRGDPVAEPVRTAGVDRLTGESPGLSAPAPDPEGEPAGGGRIDGRIQGGVEDELEGLVDDARIAEPAGGSDPDGGRTRPTTGDGFQLALDRFMEDTPAATDPAARLAALDNILLITEEALSEAPSDPVINGYYRTAVAQRNAILRQIEATRGDPVF